MHKNIKHQIQNIKLLLSEISPTELRDTVIVFRDTLLVVFKNTIFRSSELFNSDIFHLIHPSHSL